MANSFQYEISQSLTGSTFSPKDTFEFSFKAMTNTVRHKFFARQNVDIFYSASAGDGSYTRLESSDALTVPKAFTVGTAYNRKNFVFSVPSESIGVKVVITGSVGVGQGTAGGAESNIALGQGHPALNIDYDDFKLTVEKPKVEFTEEGMLVYASPSQFIKATTDGLQIKGGDLELNKITTDELEIFGDVTVFGDLQATPIEPGDTALISPVTASANNEGESEKFARADHKHQLQFSTLNDIISDSSNLITHISASAIDVGGILTADTIITEIISSSVATITGSTNFGSSSLDVHKFTGSMDIRENLIVGGHITASGNISGSVTSTGSFGAIEIPDDGRITIGDSGDLKIFHDSSLGNSVIREDGGGDLFLQGSAIRIRENTDGGTIALFTDGAGTELRHDNVKKFETTNIGINVTGNITASGDIYTTDIRFTGTTNTIQDKDDQNRISLTSGGALKLHAYDGDEIVYIGHDSNNNVGIGVATPTEKLQVAGDISASGFLKIDSHLTASGNISSSGALIGNDLILHNDGGVSAEIQSSTGDSFIRFQDGGTNKFSIGFDNGDNTFAISTGSGLSDNQAFTIKNDGNIGIGTTSPSALLDVSEGDIEINGENNSNSRGLFIKHSSMTSNITSLVQNSSNSRGELNTTSRAFRVQVGTDGGIGADEDFRVYVNNDLGLVVSSSGKVGIGTSTPENELTVEGDISASGDLNITNITSSGNLVFSGSDGNPSVDNRGVYFGTATGTTAYIRGQNAAGNQLEIGSDNVIVFKETDFNTEKIRFDMNNGKVGIGTTSPQNNDALLTVAGNISASGIVIADAFSSLTSGASIDFDDDISLEGSLTATATVQAEHIISTDDIAIQGQGSIQEKLSVGTTTHAQNMELTVAGDISASGDMFVGDDLSVGSIGSGNGRINVGSVGVLNGESTSVFGIASPGIINIQADNDNNSDGSADRIDFEVGTTEIMRISGSGNVGIGTTSPQKRLHINDSGILIDGGTGVESDSHAGTARFIIDTGGSSAHNPMDLRSDHGTLFRINGNNDASDFVRVGIGTDSPQSLLHLNGSGGNKSGLMFENAFDDVKMYFNDNNDNSNFLITYVGTGGAELELQADGDLILNGTNGDNVGIGTTSPTHKLEVKGTQSTLARFYDSSNGSIGQIEIGTMDIKTDNDTMQFRKADDSVIMELQSDGNVGIGTTTPAFTLDVIGDAAFKDQIGTGSFASGFGGHGWRINDEGEAGASGSLGWGLTLDNLTVRNQMKIYELLISQIRATNGSVWVSSTGKVESVTALTVPSYSIQFDTGSNTFGHGFKVGDLIRAQRYQGGASDSVTFRSDLIVTEVGNSGSLTAITSSTGTTPPSGGLDYVRIGNISDSSRRGSIYMTSDDDNAPYIDVIDGVTAHEDFNTSNNIKARLGKLDGINDSDYGDLSEGGNNYGLYSDNVYLKGGIRASFGAIGGFALSTTTLSASDSSFVIDSENRSLRLGNNATDMTLISSSGIFMSGSGEFRVGDPTSDQFKFSNGNLEITASQINLSGSGVGINTSTFELDSDGLDISATNKSIDLGDGKIILSGSSTPVIKIDGGEISASNFFVSSVGEMTASAGQIGGFVIDDHSLSSDGVEINKAGQTYFISSSKFKVKHTGEMTGSLVSFKGGDIANFNITSNELSSGNLILDSFNEQIRLGSGVTSTSNTGIFLDSDGTFNLATDSDNFIRKNGSDLQIKSKNTFLSGSNVEILTPSFFLGSATNNISGSDKGLAITTEELTASGSSVDIQSPNFFLGSDTSFISGSSTGLVMSSSEFKLDSTNLDVDSVLSKISLGTIVLQGSSTPFIDLNNKIRLDIDGNLHKINSVGKDTFTDTDAGFFLAVDDTTPQMNVGNSTSAIKFDGTDVQITASKVDISGSDVNLITPSFFFGDSTTSFISSSTDIEISASSFHLKNGNVTASNVDLSGKITSNEGNIAGWTITSESIETTAGGREIQLSQVSSSVRASGVTFGSTNLGTGALIASLGQTFQDSFTGNTGLSVVFSPTVGSDKALLRIDEATQSIADWNFNDTQIFNGKLFLDSTLQSLIIKDSIDRTVVTVGDQPLSSVTSSTENLFVNPSFEDGVVGYFTSSDAVSGVDKLATRAGQPETRTITIDTSTDDPSGGSKHYRISVGSSNGALP